MRRLHVQRRHREPAPARHLADVVVQRELKYEVRSSPELRAACVAWALPEPELAEMALSCRFRDPHITERFDCFRDTSAEAKVARALHIQAVNFMARK
jgi:arsenite methyltransferase